jgi:hypothetical protein
MPIQCRPYLLSSHMTSSVTGVDTVHSNATGMWVTALT